MTVPIKVEVVKWKSFDNEVFDTEERADDHEARVNGTRRTCPECNGSGSVDLYGDGRTNSSCDACGMKGYQDIQKEVAWK